MKKENKIIMNSERLRKELSIVHEGYNKYKITCNRSGKSINPTLSTKHHKYGKDMQYYGVIFYVKPECTYYSNSLQRLLWMYFKGDIPQNNDIDHINNNSLDNDLTNLQCIPHSENIRKRGLGRNQYTAGLTDEEILERRKKRSDEIIAERKSHEYCHINAMLKETAFKKRQENKRLYREFINSINSELNNIAKQREVTTDPLIIHDLIRKKQDLNYKKRTTTLTKFIESHES